MGSKRGSLAVLIAALIGGLCAAAVAAAVRESPSQLLSDSLAAARNQRSVHYRSDEVYGQLRVTMVGDAARDIGIQRIAYQRGAVAGHAVVEMIGRTVYLLGDRNILSAYMGFSPTLGRQLAGSWVLVPTTAKAYNAISAGVELESTLSELAMTAPLSKLAPSTRAGGRVIGIRGRVAQSPTKAVATLYVRATGLPLPVAEVARQGTNTFTVTFSRWNEKARIARPSPKVILH